MNKINSWFSFKHVVCKPHINRVPVTTWRWRPRGTLPWTLWWSSCWGSGRTVTLGDAVRERSSTLCRSLSTVQQGVFQLLIQRNKFKSIVNCWSAKQKNRFINIYVKTFILLKFLWASLWRKNVDHHRDFKKTSFHFMSISIEPIVHKRIL